MQRFTFNTMRLYVREGQPITVEAEGDNVRFWDHARGLGGEFVCMDAERIITSSARSFVKVVMRVYDHNQYKQPGETKTWGSYWLTLPRAETTIEYRI